MNETKKSRPNGSLGVVAVIGLAICCAGPVLIAGGALGVVGGLISNPLVVVLGIALVAVALLVTIKRIGRSADNSCDLEPPSQRQPTTSERLGQ